MEYPNSGGLDARALRALELATCKRGPRAGYILKSAPSPRGDSRDGWLAWQALMAEIAPVRCALWSLMFELRSDEDKALYRALELWAAHERVWLNGAFQRPFEFNLWHYRNAWKPEAVVHNAAGVNVNAGGEAE